jgi:hypothetical protein
MAQQIQSRRAGMSVAAAAAIIAPAVTEGVLLSERLERAAKENNAADPLHFLEYLRRMRRGYGGALRMIREQEILGIVERDEAAE